MLFLCENVFCEICVFSFFLSATTTKAAKTKYDAQSNLHIITKKIGMTVSVFRMFFTQILHFFGISHHVQTFFVDSDS